MKKETQEKFWAIVVIFIFLIVIAVVILQRIQFHRIIGALNSMELNAITSFKVYPKILRPVEAPVNFTNPDAIINDFLIATHDFQAYWKSIGGVMSHEHMWFLEIHTEQETVQISCSVPSSKGDVVIAKIGKFSERSYSIYGTFSSKALFQWYQKYSHRWLESADVQQ